MSKTVTILGITELKKRLKIESDTTFYRTMCKMGIKPFPRPGQWVWEVIVDRIHELAGKRS